MIRLLSCGWKYVPSPPLGRISVTRSFTRPCLTHYSLPGSPTMSGFASWLKRAAGGHTKSDTRSESKLASAPGRQQQSQQQAAQPPKPAPKESTAPVVKKPEMLRHGEFVGSLDCATTYVARPRVFGRVV